MHTNGINTLVYSSTAERLNLNQNRIHTLHVLQWEATGNDKQYSAL